MLLNYLAVAFGGAAGSVARYWVGLRLAEKFGEHLPWGTLFVNISGSLLIGLLTSPVFLPAREPWPIATRHLLVVGLCGGYTTFSAFSLQNMQFMHRGEWGKALINITLSVAGCLTATWLGWLLGSLLHKTTS